MNLFQILKQYSASDLEEENKKVDPISGLSTSEKWMLVKLEEKEKEFFSFQKEMSSQSIKIENEK